MNARLVGVKLEAVRVDAELEHDRGGARRRLPLARDALQEVAREHRPPLERDDARLELGEIEQLLNEGAEPLDVLQHGGQRRGLGRLDAVDEVLEHRA